MDEISKKLLIPIVITLTLLIIQIILAIESHNNIYGYIIGFGILIFLFYSIKTQSVKNGFKSLKKLGILILVLCLIDNVVVFPISLLAIKHSFFFTIPIAIVLLVYISKILIEILKLSSK